MTMEGWVEDAEELELTYGPSANLFYVTFIIINTFILMNLLIGIVVESMHQIGAQKRREHKDSLEMRRTSKKV